jgi:predicted alpha/beta hydrolase family esterase
MFCVFIGFGMVALAFVALVAVWFAGAGATGLGVVAFQARYLRAARAEGRDDLTLPTLLRLNLREARATVVLGWWHLRALFAGRETQAVGSGGERVLLVHGYTQNSTNMWGLQQALARSGRPSERVFLGLAWPWRRVEDYATVLAAALRRHPEGIWVVAHSMGGIVLREVLTQHPDLRAHVLGAVTMGTPHQGTAVHPRVAHIVRPADQLAFGAPWLRMLPTLPQLLPGRRITTIGSTADMIVYPESTTRQRGARHHTLHDVGHAGLLVDRRSLALAVEAVRPGPER